MKGNALLLIGFLVGTVSTVNAELIGFGAIALGVAGDDQGAKSSFNIVTHHFDGLVTCTYHKDSVQADTDFRTRLVLGPVDPIYQQSYGCSCETYLETCEARVLEKPLCPPGYLGRPYIQASDGQQQLLCPIERHHFEFTFEKNWVGGRVAAIGTTRDELYDECETACAPHYQQATIDANNYCREFVSIPDSYSFEGGYDCDIDIGDAPAGSPGAASLNLSEVGP